MAGLMQDTLAVDAEQMPEPTEPAVESPQGATPEAGAPDWLTEEGEMPEEQYEEQVNRALLAAFTVLSEPAVMEQQDEVMANPTGESVGYFVYDILKGINEKSGGKISDEVMPGVLFGVLAAMSEAAQLPPPVVAEAVQRSMLRFLKDSGADPKEVEAVLANMDYEAIAATAAQQGGEEDVGPV